jgi:hypothetical protein
MSVFPPVTSRSLLLRGILFFITLAFLIGTPAFYFSEYNIAFAATKTWTNGGGDGLWSNPLNWSTGSVPTSADTAVFDSTSVANASVDASYAGTVGAIQINSGYTGTITLARSLTVTGNLTQAAGTMDISSNTLTMSGGSGSITLSGGSFLGTGATTTFSGNSGAGLQTLTCTGTYPGLVDPGASASQFTLASGCSATLVQTVTKTGAISLAGNASVSAGATITITGNGNNGGLTVTGSLTGLASLATTTLSGSGTATLTLTCTGTWPGIVSPGSGNTIFSLASGCAATLPQTISRTGSITLAGNATVSSGATITISTLGNSNALTVTGSLTGLASLGTTTFSGNNNVTQTLTCTGSWPGVVDPGANIAAFTLAAGCNATLAKTISKSGSITLAGDATAPSGATITISTTGVDNGFTVTGSLAGLANLSTTTFSGTSIVTQTLTCTGTWPGVVDPGSNNSVFALAAGCAATFPKTVSKSGGLNISGDVTVPSGATIAITGTGNNQSLIYSGSLSGLSGLSTTTFSGTGATASQTLTCSGSWPGVVDPGSSASTFVLDTNCTATLAKTISKTGSITINGTATALSGSTISLTGDGNATALTVTGPLTGLASLGTTTFSGNTNGVTQTLTCTGTWPGILDPGSNLSNFTLASGCNATLRNIITKSGGITLAGGATALSGSTITISGSSNGVTVTGSLTGLASLGTTTFSGSSSGQTQTLTCTGTFPGVVDPGSGGAAFNLASGCSATLAKTITKSGNITFTGDPVAQAGSTITLNSTNSLTATGSLAGLSALGTTTFSGGTITNQTLTCTGNWPGILDPGSGAAPFTLASGCSATLAKTITKSGNITFAGDPIALTGSTITLNSSNSLTVTGSLVGLANLSTTTFSGNTINTQTLTCTGTWPGVADPGASGSAFLLASGCNATLPQTISKTGSITLAGNASVSAGATITIINNGSNLTVTGSLAGLSALGTTTFSGNSINTQTLTCTGTWPGILDPGTGTSVFILVSGCNATLAKTITKSGSITLNGDVTTQSGSTLSITAGSLLITGSAAGFSNLSSLSFSGTGSNTYLIAPSALSIGSFSVNKSGRTFSLGAPLVLSGGLTITAGTLDASTTASSCSGSCAITLAGSWSNSGTFTAQTDTVTFNGTNQSLSGHTTFYNFTKTAAAADTFTFPSGNATTTVTNALTLQGVSTSARLSLVSSSAGTQWKIDPQGTRTVSNLTVKDSQNVNATTIDASGTGSLDFGNNTYWNFGPPSVSSLGPANLTDGSYTTNTTPLFSFFLDDPVFNATVGYEFELSNSASFSPLTVDYQSALAATGTTQTFTVGQAAGGGTYLTGTAGQTLSDDSYYWRVRAYDNFSSQSSWSAANGGSVAFILDTTAPVISSIASSTTSTTATVTWTTNENATSDVEYGVSSGNYAVASSTASLVTSHSISLSGLFEGVTYYYVVVSTDGAGNTSTSTEHTFHTPDVTPPTVSVVEPADASYASSSPLTLGATASDNIAVAGVTFYIDGVRSGSEITSAPYTTTFDPTTKPDGSHSLVAAARDTSGNYATSSPISLTIDTTAPTTGSLSLTATTTSAVLVDASAASDGGSGITSYSFTDASTSAASGPHASHSWYESGLTPNALYDFFVDVTDAAGNSATSAASSTYTRAEAPSSASATIDSDTQITVSWSGGGNPAGTEYEVTNETASTTSGWITTTSYIDTGLSASTHYDYSIIARNALGFETSAATASGTTDPASSSGTSGSTSGSRPGSSSSPFSIPVSASGSLIVGPSQVSAGDTVTLIVAAKNIFGGAYVGPLTVAVAVSGANTAFPAVAPVGDGTYEARYVAVKAGTDYVTATINGTPVGEDTDGTSDGVLSLRVVERGATGNGGTIANAGGSGNAAQNSGNQQSPPPQNPPAATPAQPSFTNGLTNSCFRAFSWTDEAPVVITRTIGKGHEEVVATPNPRSPWFIDIDPLSGQTLVYRFKYKANGAVWRTVTYTPEMLAACAGTSGTDVALEADIDHDGNQEQYIDGVYQDSDGSSVPVGTTPDGGVLVDASGNGDADTYWLPKGPNGEALTSPVVAAGDELYVVKGTLGGEHIYRPLSGGYRVALSGSENVAVVLYAAEALPQASGALATTIVIAQAIAGSAAGKATASTIVTGGAVSLTLFGLLSFLLSGQSLIDLGPAIFRGLLSLFTVSYLSRRKRAWGTVYDSVTKRPLDPAIVTLISAEGKEMKTAITDLDGRYGFLVAPGSYTLSIEKSHHVFPSTRVGSFDPVYAHPYHGEPIAAGEGAVLAYDVPLDPVEFDWNETEKYKRGLYRFFSRFDRPLAYLALILTPLSLVISAVKLAYSFSFVNLGVFLLYLVLQVLFLTGRPPRLYGRVHDTNGAPVPYALVEAFMPSTGNSIGHTVADASGRYYLLLPDTPEAEVRVSTPRGDGTYIEGRKMVYPAKRGRLAATVLAA